MKDRIEELAQQIYMDEGGMPSMELRCKVITTAVNEALELAARECEKETKAGLPAMWISVASKNAAAIRKLKVSE